MTTQGEYGDAHMAFIWIGFLAVAVLFGIPVALSWPLCVKDQCSFTSWMSSAGTFVVAFTSAAASILAVKYVKDTLDATRLSVEAANDAVAENRRIGGVQRRAYLGAHEVYFDRSSGLCQFQIRNFGQSPAYRLRAKTCYRIGEEIVWKFHDFGILDPGHTWAGSTHTPEVWRRTMDAFPATMFIIIFYRDIHGDYYVRGQGFDLKEGADFFEHRAGMGLISGQSYEKKRIMRSNPSS